MYQDLTRDQAWDVVRRIEAGAPDRVRLLAEMMRDTDGPLVDMDATLESLVAVWEWFTPIALAGYPGVRTDMPSLYEASIAEHVLPEYADFARRRALLCEGVMHYVELVLKSIDPGARWDLWLQTGRVRMAQHQEPVLRLSNGTPIYLTSIVTGMAYKCEQGVVPGARDPQRLREVIAEELPRSWRGRRQDSQASVLVPYLSYAGQTPPAIVKTSPLTVLYAPSPTSESDGSSGDDFGVDLLLAVGPAAGLDDPGQFAALPVDTVAAVLAELGLALDDGRPVRPRQLLQDGTQLVDPEGTVVVETVVARRALRALSVEPAGGGTAETWTRIEDRLRGLAESLGGHLVAADSEGWPEP